MDGYCNERIYLKFNYPNSGPGDKNFLTGIRQKYGALYITGTYINSQSGRSYTYVYKGDLQGNVGPYTQNKWHILEYPTNEDETVTNTSLYGPDVRKDGSIRAVGNYNTEETGKRALGTVYEGKLNGKGIWTTLIPAEDAINTIAHSSMGDLVVGNYDTKYVQGMGFIYDMKKRRYYDINKRGAKSITAYGIWKNSKHEYTICGGYSPILNDITFGYLVDWNNKTKRFYNWREYEYENNAVITHFDGITSDGKCGYNLTGDALTHRSRHSDECLAWLSIHDVDVIGRDSK
jgi:hypothetical protein